MVLQLPNPQNHPRRRHRPSLLPRFMFPMLRWIFQQSLKLVWKSVEYQTTGSQFNVILDFGRAEVQVCGFTPNHAIKTIVNDDRNYRRLEITELRKNESLYIRCLISSPEFKKVVIEGGNIFSGKSIDFSEYQASLLSKPSNPLGFWSSIWRAIVIFVVVMIGRVILQEYMVILKRKSNENNVLTQGLEILTICKSKL